MIAPEFSRPVRIDTLGRDGRDFEVEAELAERLALARRFDLLSLDRLAARATLRREADDVIVDGRLMAAVVQACVATGEPLPEQIDVPFELRFVPALADGAEEVELDEADLDVVAYEGGSVDLGEAAAETLALSLDPFPRAPGADSALKAAGVLEEGEAGPFSALKALKDRLGG